MSKLKKFLTKHITESIGIFIIGCLSSIVFCNDCYSQIDKRWPIILYFGVIWVVLWKGNEWVSFLPDKYMSWLEKPLRRLIFGLICHVVFTILAMFLIQVCFEFLTTSSISSISAKEIIEYSIPSIVITLVILTFMTALKFFSSWRALAVRHEKLKTEAMASSFAVLKNQVNPHFLFNSLNVLTGLVYKDADLSAQFIEKLAEVYRYVLDTQEKELVPLRDELDFINSFVFLQKIRFGEYLNFSIENNNHSNPSVAPLSLQMLIENAIKHNIISEEQPLDIKVIIDQKFIVVTNTIQLKSTMPGKQGIGLNNIISRYKFMTDIPVDIINDEETFTVKIPLINL